VRGRPSGAANPWVVPMLTSGAHGNSNTEGRPTIIVPGNTAASINRFNDCSRGAREIILGDVGHWPWGLDVHGPTIYFRGKDRLARIDCVEGPSGRMRTHTILVALSLVFLDLRDWSRPGRSCASSSSKKLLQPKLRTNLDRAKRSFFSKRSDREWRTENQKNAQGHARQGPRRYSGRSPRPFTAPE